jgi:hypothetical protein
MRERLPNRRRCETRQFEHGAHRFTVKVGFYRDGRPAEVFLSNGKAGSGLESVARDSAIIASLLLQHGGDLDVIRAALTKDHIGGPASLIGAALDALREEAP